MDLPFPDPGRGAHERAAEVLELLAQEALETGNRPRFDVFSRMAESERERASRLPERDHAASRRR
jgi:hypothetical protein